jgi:hypothetical protein
MLPLVAPWIRYATVYLDDENDEVTARVMKQIPNLRWLVFDCRLQNYSPQAVSVLRNLSHVTRLSIYSCSPQLMSTLAANVQLLEAFGSKLKSLDVFCDGSSAPPDKLFHTIRDHVPSLESIYVFSTRDSLLVDLFVVKPGWPSRTTIKDAHFDECTEIDAWVVANIVRTCPVLCDLIISSCGGPGDFGETVHDAAKLC